MYDLFGYLLPFDPIKHIKSKQTKRETRYETTSLQNNTHLIVYVSHSVTKPNAFSIHKPKFLFHLNARGGVGFAVAEDIDLFVAEDFLRSSGISRHVLHSGGGYKLRLKGEVFGGSQQVGVIMCWTNLC